MHNRDNRRQNAIAVGVIGYLAALLNDAVGQNFADGIQRDLFEQRRNLYRFFLSFVDTRCVHIVVSLPMESSVTTISSATGDLFS